MNRSVFWALVRKDLYLMRGFMIGIVVMGLLSWFLMSFGGKALAVGGILFLTTNIAGAIFIAIFTLLTERKEQARLFSLSLPISGQQYEIAKLVSGYVAFGAPWLTLTGVVVLGTLLPEKSDRGMIVYVLVIQCFVLAQFSVVMAALFAVATEAVSGIAILSVNVLFSLFMMMINQPQIIAPWKSDAVVWTPFAQRMLAGEFLVMALALASALYVLSRRRDHI